MAAKILSNKLNDQDEYILQAYANALIQEAQTTLQSVRLYEANPDLRGHFEAVHAKIQPVLAAWRKSSER